MTDRISSFVVVLKENRRDDEIEATLNALWMVKGVLDVRPVVDDGDIVERLRLRNEVREMLFGIARDFDV